MAELRLIESGLRVGPRHCGHTRDIYAAAGLELWHELRIPFNPFQPMTERVFVYPSALPAIAPAGCDHSKLVPPYYGGSLVPEILFSGPDALDRAAAAMGLELQ